MFWYILFISILILLLLFLVDYLLFGKYNQSPLRLHTFDGSDQPYHPSVLYFKDSWNGYKYWMVETPYPIGGKPYKDRWECPFIHVSNDGFHWNELSESPIDDLTDEQIANKDFFSDPHIVFVNGCLECFYRYSRRESNGFHTVLLRKTSSDGVVWSDRELLADFEDPEAQDSLGDIVRSQAVLYIDGEYRMWYVDTKDPKLDKHMRYSTSKDGIFWSKSEICELNNYIVCPWHLDMAYIDGNYWLTIYDFNNLTLWKSGDGLSFSFVRVLLSPNSKYGSFYSDGLYRSSLIKDSDSFKLYFSAFSETRTSIGLMSGPTLDDMQVVSIDESYVPFKKYFIPFIQNWRRRLYPIKLFFIRAIQ